jgi:hypothetical protein
MNKSNFTRMIKLLSFLQLFLFISLISRAQDTTAFPTPTGNSNQLFFLQRSQNTNTIVYELNLKEGAMDTTQPVHIFWICYAEKGQREELTGIQRKYAYGLETKFISKDRYELHFLANKKYFVLLMKGVDNKYHVYDTINQKEVILSRIYLQLKGGSPLSPKIDYVTLTGIDPDSGKEVFEKKKM